MILNLEPLGYMALVVFLVATFILITKAANWAGMTSYAAQDLCDDFIRDYCRGERERPGYPPLLIAKHLKERRDVFSLRRALGFSSVNLLLGGGILWLTQDTTYVYLLVFMILAVEAPLLHWWPSRCRRSYQENFRFCASFYQAENRLVGQLVDHGAGRHSQVALPQDGRTLLLVLSLNGFKEVVDGTYALEIWLPKDSYNQVAWGIHRSRPSSFEADVSVFLVSCEKDSKAPPGVSHKLVTVHPEVLLPNTRTDLRALAWALKPYYAVAQLPTLTDVVHEFGAKVMGTDAQTNPLEITSTATYEDRLAKKWSAF